MKILQANNVDLNKNIPMNYENLTPKDLPCQNNSLLSCLNSPSA